ncbi:MAG: PilN domain-containing protein [Gemmatimonadaceae bacterium]|nr:PilN domain-containing protein [Gemmatimonadaceae bacterium]
MIQINLLPGAGRRSKAAGGMRASDMLASASEWGGDKYLMSAIGAVVASLGLLSFLYLHQNRVAGDLEERRIKAVDDSSRYSAVLAAKVKAESTRDSLFAQLAIIKSIDDTRYIWSHVMQEISAAMPPYTWLTAIAQTSIPPSAAAADTTQKSSSGDDKSKSKAAREKEKRLRADSLLAQAQSVKFKLTGNTVDIQALTRFIRALEASPFVQNVQLTRSDLVVNEGKEVTEFTLEAETQKPPPYMIKTIPLVVSAGGT